MKHLLRISLVAVALSASLLAFSQSAVGTWNGRIDVSGMKAKNAQEKKMMVQMKPMLARFKAKLMMKPNRTYTIVITGSPNGKGETETGKWSQAGRTVTVLDKKGKPQKMTLSANGRTMIMVPDKTQNAPKGLKMIFTKV